MLKPLMIVEGSYWGDGHIFRPERLLKVAYSLKVDSHLVNIDKVDNWREKGCRHQRGVIMCMHIAGADI